MVRKWTKIPNPRSDVKQERCTARTCGSGTILWPQMGRDGMQTRQNVIPAGAMQSRIHIIWGLIQPHLQRGRGWWRNEIQTSIGCTKMIRGLKVTECMEDGVLISVQKMTGKGECAGRWTVSYDLPQAGALFIKIVKTGSNQCHLLSQPWQRVNSECQGYGNPQGYLAGVCRGRGKGMIFETPGIPLPLWGYRGMRGVWVYLFMKYLIFLANSSAF